MAQERINFAISDELYNWIRTNPNIQSLERSEFSTIINHTMTGPQLTTLKNGIVSRLSETLS